MKSLPIIILGIIVMIFGIIFQFQGQGVIGPESSFMYQNPSWIDNGIYIGMMGVIIILIGYFVEKKTGTRRLKKLQKKFQNKNLRNQRLI